MKDWRHSRDPEETALLFWCKFSSLEYLPVLDHSSQKLPFSAANAGTRRRYFEAVQSLPTVIQTFDQPRHACTDVEEFIDELKLKL